MLFDSYSDMAQNLTNASCDVQATTTGRSKGMTWLELETLYHASCHRCVIEI